MINAVKNFKVAEKNQYNKLPLLHSREAVML